MTKTVMLETSHMGYEHCLDTLEQELVRVITPSADFDDIHGSLLEFNRISKLHDALATLRALSQWADAAEGSVQ